MSPNVRNNRNNRNNRKLGKKPRQRVIKKRVHNIQNLHNKVENIQTIDSPKFKTPLSKAVSMKLSDARGSELDHTVMERILATVPQKSQAETLNTLEVIHDTEPSLWLRMKRFLVGTVAPVAAGIIIGAIISGYKVPGPSKELRLQQYIQRRFKWNAARSEHLSDIFSAFTRSTPSAKSQGLFWDILNYIRFRTPGGGYVLSPLRGKAYYLD